MSNFRVGQKVVCLGIIAKALRATDGNFYPFSYWGLHTPQKDKIYTIRQINEDGGILLNEILNDHITTKSRRELSWNVKRFRPLITPEQDIALFHALCPGLPVVPPAVVPKRVPVPTPSD